MSLLLMSRRPAVVTGTVAGPSSAAIVVEEATKIIDGVTVLDRVSFSAQPGRVTAFLGPNGAGKSTTLRAVRPAAAAATAAAKTATTKLVGTFTIQAGKASGKKVSGSYFRMITPTGGYFGNTSSSVRGGTYTLLRPGTDNGLTTSAYQPQPSPAFARNGDSLADRIIAPTNFASVKFSASTQKVDPQTKVKVPVPTITVSGSKLSGDLGAFAASWNNQNFNQGSPKPNGAYPGRTAKVIGTYDSTTHQYSLSWRSQIVGGPFNGFAGLWHLTGKFHAA
jgi:energy-coupling factor transporter ATP-binding protein EcfA2